MDSLGECRRADAPCPCRLSVSIPPYRLPPTAYHVTNDKVQEGSNGRRGTLTVSQFGLTRGGAVTSIDIDPPMLASSPLSSDAVVETAEEDAGLGTLGRRPKPRLKDTWSAPLLWPNEVNQVHLHHAYSEYHVYYSILTMCILHIIYVMHIK